MASKTCYSSLALFLILNTLFFALASAHRCHPSRRRQPGRDDLGRPTFPPQFPGENSGFPGGNRGFPRGFPGGNRGFSGGNRPWGPPGGDPFDESTPPRRSAPSTPPGGSNGSAPSTPPGSTTPSSSGASCPREAMKFGVCANVLTGLFNVTLGQQPVAPCCTLFDGLVDLEAASCLCLALKSNVMGTNRNIPISLSVILSACSKQVPRDFQCA